MTVGVVFAMTKWHGGKGSGIRKNDDQKQYEENWEKIFNKEKANANKTKTNSQDIQQGYS